MKRLAYRVADAAAMEALGAALARALPPGAVLRLRGELGTGKTTLARGFLAERGHAGAVRSPTYTLLEPYELPSGPVYHLDLYRLADPEELDYLGLRDLVDTRATFLVEWPEHGGDGLPPADIEVALAHDGAARDATCTARSVRGEGWLEWLAADEG